MKTIALSILALLILPMALAQIDWNTDIGFGWVGTNSEDLEITEGQSAQLDTGYIRSGDGPIALRVVLMGDAGNTEVYNQEISTVIAHEIVTIDSNDYVGVGEYDIFIHISDNDLEQPVVTNIGEGKHLTLTVTEAAASNNLPTLHVDNQEVTVNQPVAIDITARDVDAQDTLTVTVKDMALFIGSSLNGVPGNSEVNYQFVLTPTVVGEFPITIQVTDGVISQPVEQTIILKVNPEMGPQRPQLTTIGGKTPPASFLATEGQTIRLAITSADANGDPITIEGRRQGEVCRSTIWGGPQVCSVVNGLANGINSIASYMGTGNNFLDLSRPLPSDMTLTNSELVWTPSYEFVQHPNADKNLPLQLRACETNGKLCSDWADLDILVRDVNRPVNLNSVPDVTLPEGTPYEVDLMASDADAEDKITFALIEGPTGMTINRGVLSWNVDEDAFENGPVYDVSVVADDNAYGSSYGSRSIKSWTITIESNEVPIVDPLGNNYSVREGQTLNFPVTGRDPDNNVPVTFESSVGNVRNGMFSWDVPYDTVAHPSRTENVQVEIRACDSLGGCGEWVSTTVKVTDVNRGPVVTSTHPTVATELVEYRYEIQATDADNDDVTFSLAAAPPGMELNGNVITWTPDARAAERGPANVTVLMADNAYGLGTGAIHELAWLITVTDIYQNHPPVIISDPVDTSRVGEEYEYCVIAEDVDGDALTYWIREGPDGMVMDGNCLRWDVDDDGTYTVDIAVSDGGYTVGQRFSLGVRDAYQNVKISSVRVTPEIAYPGDVVQIFVNLDNNGAIDLDDVRVRAVIYDLNLMRSTAEFDLEEGDEVSKTLMLQLPYAASGQYMVKITVSNDHYHESAYRQIMVI